MFHKRRPGKRRHPRTMDNHILTGPRNRFWFVFFVLFVFWYFLLYGFDWLSFPSLYSISHNQETFNQSLDVIPTNYSSSDTDIEHTAKNASEIPTIDDPPVTKPTNIPSLESDVIEDFEGLEKELEPLLPNTIETSDQDQIEIVPPNPCDGKYIYVHNIASKYNQDLIKNCRSLNKWHDMCPYFTNVGLGKAIGNPQRLLLPSGWYMTNQFAVEAIFHERMKQYKCLTNDSSQATGIYVPYYPGLDVSRYLFDDYSISVRDADSLELFKWLGGRPEWNRMGGRDHFLVAGRITWDFRRAVDEDSAWGNKVMLLPESLNMTMLTIESSPWHRNDFAIPYPTFFHPSSDSQIRQWQARVRGQKRRYLFCFAGGPRPKMQDSIRSEIMNQCAASRRCKLFECKDNKENCLKPENVMKMFQSSIFCLQPPGDSFTRRSTFDSIAAGCIPVFFNPASSYLQYLWHLPKDYRSYSVLISEREVKNKKVSIERVLTQISRSRLSAMRDQVINLIPKVIYADPRSKLKNFEDAFDLTIKGVLERIEGLKQEMKEGKSRSYEFDEENSWKYYAFGTTKPHEWDHYLNRSNRMQS